MKKFTKLFLSCALVSAMAVTASASVFADAPADGKVAISSTEGLTGNAVIGTDGTVTIEDLAITGATPKAGTEVTFLVYKGAKDTTVEAANVKGIDQNTATVQPTNKGLTSDVKWDSAAATTADATYTVMVGYTDADDNFHTVSGTFVLTESKGVTHLLGDVNLDGDVNSIQDATMVMWTGLDDAKDSYTGTNITFVDDTVTTVTGENANNKASKIGDVNLDGDVNSIQDATMIMWTGLDDDKDSHTGEEVLVAELPVVVPPAAAN